MQRDKRRRREVRDRDPRIQNGGVLQKKKESPSVQLPFQPTFCTCMLEENENVASVNKK